MTDESKTELLPRPQLTLFEAIEQEDDLAISEILGQIVQTAHEGGLEAEEIFTMLEQQDLQLGENIQQLIKDKLKVLEDAIKDQQR